VEADGRVLPVFEKYGSALPEATLAQARQFGRSAVWGYFITIQHLSLEYRSPILAYGRSSTFSPTLRPVFSLPGDYSRPGT